MKALSIVAVLSFVLLFYASSCHNNGIGPSVPDTLAVVPFTFMTQFFYCNRMGIRNVVITSQSEYDSLLTSRDSVCHPRIDFSEFTLLGQTGMAGGCDDPDYLVTILRNDVRRQITFKLLIVQHGYCYDAIAGYVWVLIPKISQTDTVVFESNSITVSPSRSSPSHISGIGGQW